MIFTLISFDLNFIYIIFTKELNLNVMGISDDILKEKLSNKPNKNRIQLLQQELDSTKIQQMKKEIFNQYTLEVVKLFDMDRDNLFVKNKKRLITDARNLLYYLCSIRPMRLVTIKECMKDNGYDTTSSSIRYGIQMMEDRVQNDKDYVSVVKKIEQCVI